MEIAVLASGSNGNACYIEDKGVRMLIDCGLPGREIERRADSVGKELNQLDAILLTHCHSDHIIGAGVIARRYSVPVFCSRATHRKGQKYLRKVNVREISTSNCFFVNGLQVSPIKTMHNVDSCGYVIGSFGLFTDTGAVSPQMYDVFPKLQAVLLESNHDLDMLINGPYPAYLKKWIQSETGHLSNATASNLIQERGLNLSLALLGHISAINNTPQLAAKTFEEVNGREMEFHVCSREGITGLWRI
jgi:phosphoribosyl 1,2-cyclic phosphodiesterase